MGALIFVSSLPCKDGRSLSPQAHNSGIHQALEKVEESRKAPLGHHLQLYGFQSQVYSDKYYFLIVHQVKKIQA